MIGRRTAVGLSLLCALLFSAIVVQSASAAKAVNTTAFTCVEKGGNTDFEDAHCDKKVPAGTGKFGHVAIKNDETTEITIDNSVTGGAEDPWVLAGKAFGAATEVTCNKVHGTGQLHNVETTGKHTLTGEVTIVLTGCSVQKPSKCDVKEPIEVKTTFEGVEGLGPEGKGMGLEFKPKEGSLLFSLNYINNGAESCALNGKSVKVEGSVLAKGAPGPTAQHSGATVDYDHAELTMLGGLQCGGVAAGIENTLTLRMKDGNPIAATTTT